MEKGINLDSTSKSAKIHRKNSFVIEEEREVKGNFV